MTHDPRETLDAAVEAACHLVLQAQRELHEWLEAKGYAKGQRDAIAAAVQRVNAIEVPLDMDDRLRACKEMVIAEAVQRIEAVNGDQP